MAKCGYYAIRMGAVVKDPVYSSNPKIIDYATNGQRTDFNDIYIASHCRFFLGSDGGPSIIPEMFRIPVVCVNWTSILRISTWVLNGLFIFKKFFLKDENRYMTFTEIMNFKFGGVDTNKIFSRMHLELIENTPEEICAVTVEMDERLNGTWETTEEDEKLQQRFWDLFGPDKLKSPNLRIGADYLRQNKDLLD
jgi:putative glycosyltransferase (TIGR04372 family)